MKTFVLIAGLWLNVDNIESFEDGYFEETAFRKGYDWCRVSMVSGDYFVMKYETCDEIIRDVVDQMEDPN